MDSKSKVVRTACKDKPIIFKRESINCQTASFDGFYIALISESTVSNNDHQSHLTILDSDLVLCTELDLEDYLESCAHIFTKASGLVRGGVNGQIWITKFNEWAPTPSIVADESLKHEITALSSNDTVIIAGSAEGEVGVWNCEGRLLQKVAAHHEDWIHSISIRGTRFLVAGNYWQAYKLIGEDYVVLRSGQSQDSTWATYTSRKKVKFGMDGKLKFYRPILPKSQSDWALLLATKEKRTWPDEIPDAKRDLSNKVMVEQEIIVKEYGSREQEIFRFSVDLIDIRYLWCDQKKLFFITDKQILMMELNKYITGLQTNTSYETAECFNLSDASGP